MKITSAQLKQIIAEEIKRAVMNEADETSRSVSSAIQTMLDVVCGDWKSQFDPMDPSMRASGKQVWEAQCDAACEVLAQKIKERKIDELIMQVEEDLHTGQFYSERSMPVVKDAERVLMMLLKQAPYRGSITLSLKNIADLKITPEELQAAKDFALGSHNVEGISFNDDGTVSVEDTY